MAVSENDPDVRTTFRLPGIPKHVQEYALCILLHLLLPFLPLLIEYGVQGRVEQKTLLLFLAIYPLAIGVTSQSKLMFGVTVVIGLVFSAFFGLASGGIKLSDFTSNTAYFCLAAVVLIHALERYNRHAADREPFLEFD